MKKAAILLMIITVFSKVIGFGRDLTLAYFYGASTVSDIYIIAISLPTILFGIIGMGISTAYIPMYTKLEARKGKNEADNYTSKLINLVILISISLVLIVLIFTESILKIFASGFEDNVLEIAISFTRISFISVFFLSIFYIIQGYLHMKGKFAIPAMLGIPMSVVTIVSIVISYHTSIYVLIVGNVIASAIQISILIIYAKKEGFKYKLHVKFFDNNIKTMMHLAFPVMMGSSIIQLSLLIDRTLASRLGEGAIASLNYAQLIDTFVQGIFVTSIITVLYPLISKYAIDKNIEAIKNKLMQTFIIICFMLSPIMVFVLCFSEEIIKILFNRGAFDQEAVVMSSTALFFYSFGMIGVAIRFLIMKVFYSLQDTKTPMINSSISVSINILLSILLSYYIGIGGIALGTSISAIIATYLLYQSLKNKIGSILTKEFYISILKIILSTIIFIIVAIFVYNEGGNLVPQNMRLLITLVISGSCYILIVYLMKIRSVEDLFYNAKSKINKEF
ncbi:murein biosynthesis integral membrane protein MurJ [Salinicoccus roseus]|uniref:murein biosynthesis integral membrane protein MurJ n=1 Tax=Salinicoccus roseus TaxID=45670 RepID=UPI001CA7068B|nr:murein biosynthesis integral membrane protein MurJ [Salinicoccus roseus]MBY8908371.1 murein biosynthesis integral membrane protein MurJ [Salinicoccus roseus]